MRDRFLKVKLNGLGWEKEAGADQAYERLQAEITKFLVGKKEFVDGFMAKTVTVTVCRELDNIHSIEEKGGLLLR
jgi:hypothetical protein